MPAGVAARRPIVTNLRHLVIGVSISLLIYGCSGDDQLTTDAPFFRGLDPAVVAEVLAHPHHAQVLRSEGAERDSQAQARVILFSVCRDAFQAYRRWLSTGQAPTLEPLPRPEQPLEPGYPAWQEEYERLQDIVATGDPDGLRRWISSEGGCGTHVPARPGDVGGPTVSQAVAGVTG